MRLGFLQLHQLQGQSKHCLNQQFLQNLYDAFNKREIETIISLMRPDVKWANGLEGGFVYGRDAVREFVTRVIHAEPDGLNINDGCGSTHLESLQAAVVEHGAHLGIAHDGDADRCLAVDASGEPIDGDQIMAILALALKEKGELAENTLVATVMSNLGLLRAMESAGIEVKQTGVGDRYVLEEMRRGGYSLGGEQSGHVIMLEHATTGDGVLTGLMLAARVAETGQSLAQLAAAMTRMPQVLINVKDVDKDRVDGDEGVRSAVADEESSLGLEGRVLLRKSGTEPVVRVMVEAATEERARTTADRLSGVVKERLSL